MSISLDTLPPKREKYLLALGLIFSLLIGGFVRFVHVLPEEYPLNDGGFYLTLIQDLQEADALMPAYTSYNQTGIPFAYPPLALFTADLLSRSLNVPALELIRVLPPLLSCLTIPAFYALANRLLSSKKQIIAATITYALLPTAFDPLIVGAGLTRAAGFCFAILTLIQIHSLYSSTHKRHVLLTIFFAGLTILSHPGTAWFTFYSGGVLFLFSILSQKQEQIKKSILVVLGTATLTSPWWATQIHRHGLQTLLNPFQTEAFSLRALITPFSLLFTNEPLVDILAVIGFLGLLISLRDRKYLLPGWLLAVFIFEPRLSAVYAAIPMALLVGIGLDQAVLPLVASKGSAKRWGEKLTKITLGFLLAYTLTAAYLAPQYKSLSGSQGDSLVWISQHTPKSAVFIVMTGNESYGDDYTVEWFPSLARRQSATTPQGHEWLPEREFSRRVSLHAELQTYADADIASLEAWAKRHQLSFSHVYIAKKALRENEVPFSLFQESITNSSNYELIFDNDDALIFAKSP